MATQCRAPASTGFSLIEVLIAVAVLAIGLLAVAALQIQGVRQNFDSYARSQAVMLANDFVERMYANKPGADLGNYADSDTDAFDCATDTPPAQLCGTQSDAETPEICTPSQIAVYDQYIVSCGYATPSGRSGGVRDLLQSGRLRVVECLDPSDDPAPCQAGFRYRIQMSWVEQVKDGNNRSGAVVANDLVLTVQP